MKLSELCMRYVAECRLGKSQRYVLAQLARDPIGRLKAPGEAKEYIAFARRRVAEVSPATVLNSLVALRGVLSYAKHGWGLKDVTDQPIRDAWKLLRKQGLIGTATRRDRRPTEEETQAILKFFRERHSSIPLADIVEFQGDSSRRISETCRLQWGDLDERTKTILVRDMKHPSHKEGNHRRVALPDKSFEIIMRQPRRTTSPEERIFPYLAKTIQWHYRRAVKALGFKDLHLHDSRRGATTRLLEQGRTVPEAMLVTGHLRPDMVLTTYNGLKAEDFHRRKLSAGH